MKRALAETSIGKSRWARELKRMNAIFFASASVMLLLAMFFATAPLLRNARSSSGGFAYVPLPTAGMNAGCRRLPTALLQRDAFAQAKDVMQINPNFLRASSYSRSTHVSGTVSHFLEFVHLSAEGDRDSVVFALKNKAFFALLREGN